MSQTSPNLDMPYLQPAQAQKHVTHNQALQILDALVQLSLEGVDENTPPVLPQEGETWAVGTAPTGSWAGHPGALAVWANGGWMFLAARDGILAWDNSAGELIAYSGGSWAAISSGSTSVTNILGINATADTTNRLAVSAPATLFNHEGAGHQLKLNKSGTADTVSLLYQTGFSGRAELGLAGTDNWSIKVSPDGASWTTALEIDAATGAVSGSSVQSDPTDTGNGILARADFVYGPGNLLGSVSEAGGVPTGAVIESGSNGNGRYVRFADGTQMCVLDQAGFAQASADSLTFTWSFPAPFSAAPTISHTLSADPADHVDTGPGDLSSLAMLANGTSAQLSLYRIAGASALSTTARMENTALLAIGRWF